MTRVSLSAFNTPGTGKTEPSAVRLCRLLPTVRLSIATMVTEESGSVTFWDSKGGACRSHLLPSVARDAVGEGSAGRYPINGVPVVQPPDNLARRVDGADYLREDAQKAIA